MSKGKTRPARQRRTGKEQNEQELSLLTVYHSRGGKASGIMPRVKLNRDARQERLEYRRNLIESKARARGYRTQGSLAQAMGKGSGWLSRRLCGKSAWEAEDWYTLDKLLRFDAEELAHLVRGR